MNHTFHKPFQTFKMLFATDLKILRLIIIDKTIDSSVWVILNILISAYLMPYFGITSSYGEFMLAGTFASIGLFEVWPAIVNLVSDLQGEKIIEYHLNLPLPSYMVFMRLILFYALNIFIMQIIMLPLSILLLYNRFSISNINPIQLVLMMITSNVLYGSFVLYMASRVDIMENIGKVWMRFLFPLWYIGGYHFSWKALYTLSPTLAYINLLNPMTWVMEGIRGSLLESFDFLPFYACFIATACMGSLFAWRGISRLKSKLDCL